MDRQVLDPLDHGPVGHVQLRGLLPIATLGCRGLNRQCHAIVDVSMYDHLVFSPAIPLAGADGHVVRNQALGPKLEVVGADQA
jgi:hypothetical protein